MQKNRRFQYGNIDEKTSDVDFQLESSEMEAGPGTLHSMDLLSHGSCGMGCKDDRRIPPDDNFVKIFPEFVAFGTQYASNGCNFSC